MTNESWNQPRQPPTNGTTSAAKPVQATHRKKSIGNRAPKFRRIMYLVFFLCVACSTLNLTMTRHVPKEPQLRDAPMAVPPPPKHTEILQATKRKTTRKTAALQGLFQQYNMSSTSSKRHLAGMNALLKAANRTRNQARTTTQTTSSGTMTGSFLKCPSGSNVSYLTREDLIPTINRPDQTPPLKVFILMGQSNMYGQARVRPWIQPGGKEDTSLRTAVFEKRKFQYLTQMSTVPKNDQQTTTKLSWRTFPNIQHVQVEWINRTDRVIYNHSLTVQGRELVGPEMGIGWMLHKLFGENQELLLVKACTGNRALGWDLLPPGSKRYTNQEAGFVYAGYKDSPAKWEIGTEPEPFHWYAGIQYEHDTAVAKRVLDDIRVPYEIAGFFWWQGEKDRWDDVYTRLYERNFVQLIQSLRKDFDTKTDTPFVAATVGFKGYEMDNNTQKVWQAQMAINNPNTYPNFKGNVQSVDIRDYWRTTPMNRPHYGFHAETHMEVGQAMGKAMGDLLVRQACTEKGRDGRKPTTIT